MKGYKVFDKDLKCLDKQYTIGKKAKHDGKIIPCQSGIHFCAKANDCFNYYAFSSDNRVCEVEALGNIVEHGDKYVTDHIYIIRELTWHEVLDVVNIGKSNTGRGNTGDRNTGNWNTGDLNTGNWNTGDLNTGDRNTGNWNTCDYSTGFFNTKNEKVRVFNDTLVDRDAFVSHPGYKALMFNNFPLTEWISSFVMTDEEKKAHPCWEAREGFLKQNDYHYAWARLWNNLTDEDKQNVQELPGFKWSVFTKITGIKKPRK